MSARRTAHVGPPPLREEIERRLHNEGVGAWTWSNEPRTQFAWHAHDFDKVLYCVGGSITFHTREGDIEMTPGDRLDLPAGTEHAATTGPDGVTCSEGHRAN